MENALLDTPLESALQQPEWDDIRRVQDIRAELSSRPALVDADAVWALRALLAEVAAGKAHVMQAGDCAEDPSECTEPYVNRKAALLDVLAGMLAINTHKPVIRIGRMAGQFCKPRSNSTERVGGVELPVYRGHMVNSPEPDAASRRPDPQRLLGSYRAASEVLNHLGWHAYRDAPRAGAPVWVSHEALLLDYEIPMLRRGDDGLLLASTHWPWIGERTRQVNGAHVGLLAGVVNPMACKVGPKTTVTGVLALCARLDPLREAGRLTLIARMGADNVAYLLPPLVAAVRAAEHPVIWLCDPMHGNTVTTAGGLKTRFVESLVREVRSFQNAVRISGGVDGGLHLEATPDAVTECVSEGADEDHVGDAYTTLCDPRLNLVQAISVASAWND